MTRHKRDLSLSLSCLCSPSLAFSPSKCFVISSRLVPFILSTCKASGDCQLAVVYSLDVAKLLVESISIPEVRWVKTQTPSTPTGLFYLLAQDVQTSPRQQYYLSLIRVRAILHSGFWPDWSCSHPQHSRAAQMLLTYVALALALWQTEREDDS